MEDRALKVIDEEIQKLNKPQCTEIYDTIMRSESYDLEVAERLLSRLQQILDDESPATP